MDLPWAILEAHREIYMTSSFHLLGASQGHEHSRPLKLNEILTPSVDMCVCVCVSVSGWGSR